MSEQLTNSVPLDGAQQMIDKIANLQQLLQANAPGYDLLLRDIHAALCKDEELCHILTDEQIGVICSGLSKKTGVVIATTTAKNKSSSGKKLSDLTIDELG